MHEATYLGDKGNSLLSESQLRHAGVWIDSVPRMHGGTGCLVADRHVIPSTLDEGLMTIKIRRPTKQDYDLYGGNIIEFTSPDEWRPEQITEKPLTRDEYLALVGRVEKHLEHHINATKTRIPEADVDKLARFFLYPGETVLKQTLQNTTQYGSINMRIPMREHYKARNPLLSRRRITEPYATDTKFATVTSFEGYNCMQTFLGINSKHISHYGLKSESDGPDALRDFFRAEGVPISILRDNSKMQTGALWTQYMRDFWVKDKFIEPHHSNQNPCERYTAITNDRT